MDEAVCIQPERALLTRLRQHAGLSQGELDKLAGFIHPSCYRLENGRGPLQPRSRRKLVVYLRTLLGLRHFDYPSDMRAWRGAHGLSMRAAAAKAGISYNVWLWMENRLHTRFPCPSVRQRVDAVLEAVS